MPTRYKNLSEFIAQKGKRSSRRQILGVYYEIGAYYIQDSKVSSNPGGPWVRNRKDGGSVLPSRKNAPIFLPEGPLWLRKIDPIRGARAEQNTSVLDFTG